MGELLTDRLAHKAENIAYLAHYRTNLLAPELGDNGESQGAPSPQSWWNYLHALWSGF